MLEELSLGESREKDGIVRC